MFNVGTLEATLSLNSTKFKNELNIAKQQLEQFSTQMKAIDKAISKSFTSFNFADFKGNMAGLRMDVESVGRSVTGLGSTFTQVFTKNIIETVKETTSQFVNFDDSILKLGATAQTTTEELDILRSKALQLGKDTRYTAQDAAAGMNYLAAAGLDTEEILATIPGTLNMAAGAGISIAEASYIASAGLKQMGLDVAQATHLTDVYSQAARNSNTTVTTIGESMQNIGTIAGSLGYDIADVATAIGLMGNVGVQGGKAGTGLKSMLKNIMSPTSDEAKQLMQDRGISMVDANTGEMKSLKDLMLSIREAFKYVNDAQKAQAAELIAGSYGWTAMLAIIDSTDEAFEQLSNKLHNADGTAAAMAEEMESGLGGALRIAKSAMENSAITIGEQFVPMIRKGTEVVKQLDEYIGSLNDQQFNNIIKWGLVLVAIGPVLTIIGKLITGVGALMGAMSTLGTAMGFLIANPFVAVIGGIAVAMGAYTIEAIKAKSAQEELNKQLNETLKLGKNTTQGSAFEADGLRVKINQLQAEKDEYDRLMGAWETTNNELYALSMEQQDPNTSNERYIEISPEINDTVARKQELEELIREWNNTAGANYGGIEGLEQTLNSNTSRLDNINKANVNLSKIEDPRIRELYNKALEEETGNVDAEVDLMEYRALFLKEFRNDVDNARMEELTMNIIGSLGPDIIGEDGNLQYGAAFNRVGNRQNVATTKQDAILNYNDTLNAEIAKQEPEVKALEDQLSTITDLVTAYDQLSSKTEKTAQEKEELARVLKELEKNVDEGVVVWNKETQAQEINRGALELQKDAIRKLIAEKRTANAEMKALGIQNLKDMATETEAFIRLENTKRLSSIWNKETNIDVSSKGLKPTKNVLSGSSVGGELEGVVVALADTNIPAVDAAVQELQAIMGVISELEKQIEEDAKKEDDEEPYVDISTYLNGANESLSKIVQNTNSNNVHITVTGNQISENVDVDKIGNTIVRRLRGEGYIS